jgi:hypothetical protein
VPTAIRQIIQDRLHLLENHNIPAYDAKKNPSYKKMKVDGVKNDSGSHDYSIDDDKYNSNYDSRKKRKIKVTCIHVYMYLYIYIYTCIYVHMYLK